MLELDGEVWGAANAPVAARVKMFFWSSNWAGMREEQEPGLTVVATRLDGPGTVRTDHATNAAAESLGGEAMLSRIELPTPGCWHYRQLSRRTPLVRRLDYRGLRAHSERPGTITGDGGAGEANHRPGASGDRP